MNNIEKLAIEKMIYEHTGFNPNVADDAETIKHIKNLLEAFAKALQQSSESVAKVIHTKGTGLLEGRIIPKVMLDAKYADLPAGTELFTFPPASVSKVEYDKLLDALKRLVNLYIRNDGHNQFIACITPPGAWEMTTKQRELNKTWAAFDNAQQAIAEAEGKEG